MDRRAKQAYFIATKHKYPKPKTETQDSSEGYMGNDEKVFSLLIPSKI
jgi:hypothetical protein